MAAREWIPVTDPYEELAELYATQHEHQHNALISQHEAQFDVDIAFETSAGKKHSVTFEMLQNQSTQSKGQTGFCLWDGSVCLAMVLSTYSRELGLAGSHIVELGAGSGLVSLSLMHHDPPVASITATDQEALLKHLQRNFAHHQARFPRLAKTTEVNVAELEWAHNPSLFKRHPALRALGAGGGQGWDLIVSSDCVYNEFLVPDYVATLADLLHRPDGLHVRALVCFELRSSEVTGLFLETLLEHDLVVSRLAPNSMPAGLHASSLIVYLITTAEDAQQE
ncbi:hypothetical protein AMAG_13332 [Allomyces macrogynus ATCC 38327]|uniref:Uncharacterized protein n=1 Tax=Allomyces macrogynus (strain ATCC 38327) TaxID=578462 RepID=A0A0L0T0J6_ALLM3|nr:hypothetical protein AMAG_13332 [Allomyces macrogynus ATCC 38327]|eukprot:KNE68170.1 hypothetical protein AMAG_13332 [Allomyces macrogynus ATCC 38327]